MRLIFRITLLSEQIETIMVATFHLTCNNVETEDVECIWIEVKCTQRQHVLIGSIYKPPSQDVHDIILDKIYTHSLNGFTNDVKLFLLQTYQDTCTVPNCYICSLSNTLNT